MKEIENNTDKWKDLCIHELEELILLECPYYPNQSINSIQSLIKFHGIFKEIEKAILKFIRTTE